MADKWYEIGRESIRPRAVANWVQGTFDRRSWEELAEAGFWEIALPRSLGGQGKSLTEFSDALQSLALGGRDLGFCLSVIAHAGMLRSIVKYGTEEQLSEFLPAAVSGGVGLTALTEPESGSDVSRTQTFAKEAGNGTYILNGTKDHITHGPIADIGLVLGRCSWLEEKRDISVFLLNLNDDSISRAATEDVFGNRTSPTGAFDIQDLQIDEKNILGDPGDGLSLIYDTICLDRLLYGIVAVPFLRWIRDELMAFSKERVAFGRSIREYQYVQERIVSTDVDITSVDAVSRSALDGLSTDDPTASKLASTAKMLGSEALLRAANNLVRVFGHAGYESGWHSRLLADASGVVIAGGTVEMQKKNIFTQLLREEDEG